MYETESCQRPSSEARNKWIKRMKQRLDYATIRYGCIFPKGFAKLLYEVSFEKWIPSEAVMDALYKEWEVWKPYVSEDSLNEFMIDSIKSICKFHATSTISMPNYGIYIGRKATVVKSLPTGFITSVNKRGILSVN